MSLLVRLAWHADMLLGEGPAWSPDEQALWFVDIHGGTVRRHFPDACANESFAVGGKPSFIVPAADGGMIVGSENGIYGLENGRLGHRIVTIDMPAHNRTNDATVDTLGRLWFGTMDDDEQLETGALYCLDRGDLHRMSATAVVTNGPALTADARMLYFVDSARRAIWRYEIADGPALASAELFLQLEEADGYPDGIVLDSEDCIWVALWGGWGVRRYAPDGRLLLHVDLPCERVTKVAFGGPTLQTVFVTTARAGLSDAELAHQPLAGSLFAFEAPVAGRLLPPYQSRP